MLVLILLKIFIFLSPTLSQENGCSTLTNETCQLPFRLNHPDFDITMNISGCVALFGATKKSFCPMKIQPDGFGSEFEECASCHSTTNLDELWECNGNLIPNSQPCDGKCPVVHENQWSLNCGEDKCGPLYQHRCQDKCLRLDQPCEGKCEPGYQLDCQSNRCTTTKRPPRSYMCNDTCISIDKSCDGQCQQNDDSQYWKCPDEDKCIFASYICGSSTKKSRWTCDNLAQDAKTTCEDQALETTFRCPPFRRQCQGHRRAQCVFSQTFCDGKYDCMDRSDEADCESSNEVETLEPGTSRQEAWKNFKTIAEVNFPQKILEPDLFEVFQKEVPDLCFIPGQYHYLASFLQNCTTPWYRDEGLGFSNVACLPKRMFCNLKLHNDFTKDLFKICPVLHSLAFDTNFCQDHDFWHDQTCNLDNLMRCKGRYSGHCVHKDCLCKNDTSLTCCPDQGEMICDSSDPKCGTEGMWHCANKLNCIKNSLVCDGYAHCPDGSDETEELCKPCPRKFGFPEENRKLATFSCRNRFTANWICSVPCNGYDDFCQDGEDERCASFIFSIVICMLIALLLGTVFAGEMVMKLSNEKQKEGVDLSNENDDDRVHLKAALSLYKLAKESSPDKGKSQNRSLRLGAKFLVRQLHTKGQDEQDMAKVCYFLKYSNKKSMFQKCCKWLYQIETDIHKGDFIARDFCLLRSIGTSQLANDINTAVYPGILKKLSGLLVQLIKRKLSRFSLPFSYNSIIENDWIHRISVSVQTAFHVAIYYIDLMKDVLLIYFLGKIIPIAEREHFFSPAGQIFLLLLVSILFSEICNIILILSLSSPKLTFSQKLILLVTFPFFPSLCYFFLARIGVKIETELKRDLSEKLARFELEDQSKEKLKFEDTLIEIVEQKSAFLKWQKLLAICRENENTFEQFIQVTLLFLVTLLRFTKTKTADVFQDLIAGGNDITILALSALWSIRSLVSGSVLIAKLIKDGFLPFMGVLFLIFTNVLNYVSRIAAIIVFFAPSLGLFNLLMHFKFGEIDAQQEKPLVFDVIQHSNGTSELQMFRDIWRPLKDSTELTELTFLQYYCILLAFFVSHCCLVTLIKAKTTRMFERKKKRSLQDYLESMFHILSQFVKINPYKDIDEEIICDQEKPGNLGSIQTYWRNFRREYLSMLILFTVENILLCFPTWILWTRLDERQDYLLQYFPPLPEEMESFRNATILAFGFPIFFFISSLLQWQVVKLYYKIGHPWASIISKADIF